MDAKFWAELKKEKAETNRSHFGRRSSGNPNVIIDCQWKGVHDDIMSVLSHAPRRLFIREVEFGWFCNMAAISTDQSG